jgi:hypothetical protein
MSQSDYEVVVEEKTPEVQNKCSCGCISCNCVCGFDCGCKCKENERCDCECGCLILNQIDEFETS